MPKLREINVRMRVRTISGYSFAIPVRLTGRYDRTAYGNSWGTRVSHVEIAIENREVDYRATAWVPISDIENTWSEQLQYRELRRALLVLWVNKSRDCDPPDRCVARRSYRRERALTPGVQHLEPWTSANRHNSCTTQESQWRIQSFSTKARACLTDDPSWCSPR